MNNRKGEELERWLALDLDRGQMEEFEDGALADAEMAEEIYAAIEIHGALEEAAALEPAILPRRFPKLRSKSWARAGGLLAAVLALVILLPRDQGPETDLPLRLRGGGGVGAAIAVEPMGEVEAFPRTFRWRPPQALEGTRYRWELYDAQARRRAVAVVADSLLVRPAAETPADSLGSWRWLVIELKPNGREGATSAAVEFTVIPKESE